MAGAVKDTAYAEDAVIVHVKAGPEPAIVDGKEIWDVQSQLLYPGQTISLSELPPYLSDAIKKGNVPKMTAITAKQAERAQQVASEYKKFVTEVEPEELESDPDFPAEEI